MASNPPQNRVPFGNQASGGAGRDPVRVPFGWSVGTFYGPTSSLLHESGAPNRFQNRWIMIVTAPLEVEWREFSHVRGAETSEPSACLEEDPNFPPPCTRLLRRALDQAAQTLRKRRPQNNTAATGSLPKPPLLSRVATQYFNRVPALH